MNLDVIKTHGTTIKKTISSYFKYSFTVLYGRYVSRITILNHKVSKSVSVLMKIKLNTY